MPSSDFIDAMLEGSPSASASAAAPPSFIDAVLGANVPPSESEVPAGKLAPAPQGGQQYVLAPQTAPWNIADTLAQGATLGGYAPALAFARSLKAGTSYPAERARLGASEEAYKTASPTTALVGELGGSLPTTLAGMALGQEYLAAPMIARAASLAPKVAQYVAEAEGIAPWLLRASGRLMGYGMQGAEGGLMQMGLTGQSPSEAATSGAAVGALAGPVGSALASPLKSAVAPATQSIAQKFEDLGVTLRTNQLPGAPKATGYLNAAPTEKQLSDYTRALSKTFGENADTIDSALLHGTKSAPGAFDRIGAKLENAARSSIIPGSDPQLVGDLRSTLQRAANEFGPDSPEYAKVARLALGVADSARESGTISGNAYLDLTQKGAAIKNAMARTSPTRQYAIEFKDALDSALERANPAQAKDIAQARHWWHNALIAEDNVSELGKADPHRLLAQVESGRHYGSAYRAASKAAQAGDSGDIGTLAVGGKAFLSSGPTGLVKYAEHHPGLTAGGLGLGVLGTEHLLEPGISHMFAGHPLAAAGALGAGATYGGLGALMNRPGYANLLMRGIDPAQLSPNALVPLATYEYGLQGSGMQ